MAESKKADYRRLSSELDEILRKLEAADLDIDEAMSAYERGMTIVKELEAYLETAENTITKLKRRFGEQ